MACGSVGGAEESVLDEALGGGVEPFERPVDALERADGGLRRVDAVLSEGELVELPDPVPVVLAQGVEELEDLGEVDGADDQVVVPRRLSLTSMPKRRPWSMMSCAASAGDSPP
ncbi:hypothetical protein ACQP2P_28120 [Dactylosporangium sp. CA-139114]|uniref:hypothetical protein n=1 Tax=Dactylosporangium sp. CA-139114 TaxID=3239931 RepID=UPI003D98BA89